MSTPAVSATPPVPVDTTKNTAKAWHPDITRFLPAEVLPEALVRKCTTIVGNIEGDEPAVRVPWIADDGKASVVPEGELIPGGPGALTETVIRTAKFAELGWFSRELSLQPGASAAIATAMSRSVTLACDRGFLGNSATDGPPGLLNISGITDGGTLGTNLDAVVDAVATIQADNGVATHIVLSPGAWATVAKMKTQTGGNASLIGAGVDAAELRLLGCEVLVSNAMPAGELLVLDKGAVLSAEGAVAVARSDDAFFAYDSVAVRVTYRVGWGIMHPARVVKISTGATSTP